MVNYVTLDAVMNYLPSAIIKNVDEGQIKSWVYQAYRTMEYLPEAEELRTVSIAINQHKAVLPEDVKRIVAVKYTDLMPSFSNIGIAEIDENKLFIYQKIFFSSEYWRDAKPLRYKGQMRAPLIDDELYCNDCQIGFTIDSTMRCLTIDHADGNVLLAYMTVPTENGELIIPDDTNLLMGLSHYVQSQYWNEMTYSHEANSMVYSERHLAKAVSNFNRYKGRRIAARVHPARHRAFVFERNPKFNR